MDFLQFNDLPFTTPVAVGVLFGTYCLNKDFYLLRY